ncbi:MAG: hypothetical protein Q8R00_05125 [Candidatus Nanoarchaeia archaeon]|nr:hypothetical protein [Candidatus Nanoarchaeia archaeon]
MKALITITLILVFALGWGTNALYAEAKVAGVQTPAEFLNFTFNNSERLSPSDTISEDQIWVYEDYAVINVSGLSLAKYEDTNSMDPVLDKEANGLEIRPYSPKDLNIGDIVAYRSVNNTNSLIVHRIVNTSTDKNGNLFYILKGDNNAQPDPERIYFNQIEYKLIGVLW